MGGVALGTVLLTDRGLLPLELLPGLDGEPNRAKVFRSVAAEGRQMTISLCHPYARATRSATTRRGYTLCAAADQSVRVWNEGSWAWIRMDSVRPDMVVPIQSSGLIGRPHNVWLDATIATDFHPSPVTLPERLTPELAYLVGMFMGDGSLKARSLRYAVSDPQLKSKLEALIQSVFGAHTTSSIDQRSTWLESLEVHSVNLVSFWQRNGFAKTLPGEGHRGKGYRPHVPLTISQSNSADVYAAFLAGVLDADGCVHAGRLLAWTTTDRAFHDQVKAILLALGILTTSDLQTTGMGQSTAYRLRTSHGAASARLVAQLPLLHRAAALNRHPRRPTLRDVVPLSDEQSWILLRMASGTEEYLCAQSWRKQGVVTRDTLERFVAVYRRAMLRAGLHDLVVAIEQPMFYDRIQSVEDSGSGETCGLDTCGADNYVANGFICQSEGVT